MRPPPSGLRRPPSDLGRNHPRRSGEPRPQVRLGLLSADESRRVSPKLVRVSPKTLNSDVSNLLWGTPPNLIQRPVRSVPLVPPASRKGMLFFPCEGGSAISLPKKTTLSSSSE